MRASCSIQFEHVAVLDHNRVLHRARLHRKLRVTPQVPIVAVNRDEELRPHQVDEQPQFFLAAVPAHVNQPVRAVIENHVGFAPAQVIDHADRCSSRCPE